MRIFVGIPTYQSQVHVGVMDGFLDLALECKEKGVELSKNSPSMPFLSLARNIIMQQSIDSKSDWTLMWDSDIEVLTKGFVWKMIETAYKYDAVMVGLLIRIKSFGQPEYACGMKVKGGYDRLKKTPLKPKKVDAMGAGVTLIKNSWVVKNLKQPYYEFRDSPAPGITPEDWVFSEKIKEKGGKIVVDPTIETLHYGQSYWANR